MNKKNLGLIALFILLIAAVVLLTAGETREEDAPLPDRAAQHADQRRRLRDGIYHADQLCRRAGGSDGLGAGRPRLQGEIRL